MKKQTVIPQEMIDPEEKLVFGWNWVDQIEEGDTLDTSEWTLETNAAPAVPLVITPGSPSLIGFDTACKVEFTAGLGTIGVTYLLKNKVTTLPSGSVGIRRIEIRVSTK